MKIEYINTFPTLITVTENVITPKQCLEIKEFFWKTELHAHDLLDNDGLSNYGKHTKFLDDVSENIESCKYLKSIINDLFHDYSNISGIMFEEIFRSWANFQPKGSKLLPHTHPGSFITGVLYISVEAATPLLLHNPNSLNKINPKRKITKYTDDTYTVNPKQGMVILFPGWLEHSTDVSYSEERIVISFNGGVR